MLKTQFYEINWWNENVERQIGKKFEIVDDHSSVLKEIQTDKQFQWDLVTQRITGELFVSCKELKGELI